MLANAHLDILSVFIVPPCFIISSFDCLRTCNQHVFHHNDKVKYGREYTSDHPVISDIRRILEQQAKKLTKQTSDGEP